jgi:hypothetical protein
VTDAAGASTTLGGALQEELTAFAAAWVEANAQEAGR